VQKKAEPQLTEDILTDAEKKMVEDFSRQINLHDSNGILQSALTAAREVDVDGTIGNIRMITEKISSLNPDARVILLTVYDPFAGNVLLDAAAAAAALLSAVSMPYFSLQRAIVACVFAEPIISFGFTSSFLSIPPIMASAIFPSPINPIFTLIPPFPLPVHFI